MFITLNSFGGTNDWDMVKQILNTRESNWATKAAADLDKLSVVQAYLKDNPDAGYYPRHAEAWYRYQIDNDIIKNGKTELALAKQYPEDKSVLSGYPQDRYIRSLFFTKQYSTLVQEGPKLLKDTMDSRYLGDAWYLIGRSYIELGDKDSGIKALLKVFDNNYHRQPESIRVLYPILSHEKDRVSLAGKVGKNESISSMEYIIVHGGNYLNLEDYKKILSKYQMIIPPTNNTNTRLKGIIKAQLEVL